MAKEDGFHTFLVGWAPVVDGSFLPSHPFDGAAPEISKDIPMIIGTTCTEFSPRPYVPAILFRQCGSAQDRNRWHKGRRKTRAPDGIDMDKLCT